MALIIVFLAGILIVSALRNTQSQLGAALSQDGPGYLVWAAAIFAIGAIGFIPGLKSPSRALMALVLTVIILKNYQGIINGFTSVQSGVTPTTAPATPAQSVTQQAASAGTNWAGNIPGPLGYVPQIVNGITSYILKQTGTTQ